MVTIYRSRKVYGPFEPHPNNPIISNRSKRNSIQCVGHADLISDDKGQWWAVCLGVRINGKHGYYHHLGREIMLTHLEWPVDSWPVASENGVISTKMKLPSGVSNIQLKKPQSFYLKMSEDPFPEQIVFIRTFETNQFLKKRSGVWIKPLPSGLDEVEPISFFGVRQTDFLMKFYATFQPTECSGSYGVTVYMSQNYHYDCFVQSGQLVLRKRVGSIDYEEVKESINMQEHITIHITSNESFYTFHYEQSGQKRVLGSAECRHIASEVSSTFTGVLLGVYATSENMKEKVQLTAFSYDGLK